MATEENLTKEKLNERFHSEETRQGVVFTSLCHPKESCPPAIVARIALGAYRKKGPEIVYPEGYNEQDLKNLWYYVGHFKGASTITEQDGRLLANIGGQLLTLDASGLIKPPLKPKETTSIQHLIGVVAATQATIITNSDQ